MTGHSVCPFWPSRFTLRMLLFWLLCLTCPGSADELQRSPSQPECLFSPLPDSTLGSFSQSMEDGMQDEALSALPAFVCAFVVPSCFWYQCYIKVAKSEGRFLLFRGRGGSEWPVVRPSGTGGGHRCLKGWVGVGWALGGLELNMETTSFQKLQSTQFHDSLHGVAPV